MDKNQIISKLKELNQKGFIKASDFIPYRHNDNGEIGRLVEFFFDVDENNFSTPDLGDIELKATIGGAPLTFGSSKPIQGMSTREQYEQFKKPSPKDGLYRFNKAVTSQPDSDGFYFKYEDESIKLYQYDNYLSSYNFDLNRKTSKVLFVFAKKMGSGADASYHIKEAYLAEEPKNIEQVILEDQDIFRLEIRCGVHTKNKQRGKLHDRGTAIRFKKNKLSGLFTKYERLL